MFKHLTDQIEKQVCGKNIKKLATDIFEYDRHFTFPAFHKSAELLKNAYRQSGIKNARITSVPADGKTKIYDYIMPIGWDAKDAVLTLIHESGKKEKLASYIDEPITLFNYSTPTPKGGITAEVVHAENEKKIEKMNCKGKIVFLHERVSRRIYYFLHKAGAIGLISDWRNFKRFSRQGIKWGNYEFFPDNPFKLFGFSISHKQGDNFLKLFKQGKKVTVHAQVNTRLYKDKLDLVSARIKGKTSEEIIAYAHLFEYGAWDNAAGCAIIHEAAKVINRLINQDRLNQPKRNIVFLNGFECYGPVIYLAQHKNHKKIIAGINIDGVGVNMYEMNAPLYYGLSPAANPNYADPLIKTILHENLPLSDSSESLAREALFCGPAERDDFPLVYKSIPFAGCDALFADPCFNIPFAWLVQFNKRLWHNSLDKPDKLDPDVLAKITAITAAYLYSLAQADWNDVQYLSQDIINNTEKIIADYTLEKRASLTRKLTGRKNLNKNISKEIFQSEKRIHYLCDQNLNRLQSLERLVPTAKKQEFKTIISQTRQRLQVSSQQHYSKIIRSVKEYCTDNNIAGNITVQKTTLSSIEKKAVQLIPERLIPGILTLETLPEKIRYNNPWGPDYQVLLSEVMWVDGKRSIYDIHKKLEQETGVSDLKKLIECFRFLEKYGYVKIRRLSHLNG